MGRDGRQDSSLGGSKGHRDHRHHHDRRRHRSRSRSRNRSRSRSRNGSRKQRSRSSRGQGRPAVHDFEVHRAKLDRIFFGSPDELVAPGTPEYDDFWKFLRKYQAMEKARAEKRPPIPPPPSSSNGLGDGAPPTNLGVPQGPYDPKLCSNFCLLPSDPKDLLNRIPFQDYDSDDDQEALTEDMVAQFRNILSVFVGFLQKEKFNKLRKMRAAQASLPISEHRDGFLGALQDHQVVVVAGDTGCGKSTQIPRYLLEAGYQGIACTQPRRIACVSLAKRVSYETLNEYGSEIGYQIRFEKKRTDRTNVLFLTEGLLLRQLSADPGLTAYDVIVLDEVHERHLQGDVLLGAVRCLMIQRPELKVVLMSATINIDLFRSYFGEGGAPVIQVPGRLHPIKLQYMPVPVVEKSSDSEKLNPAPYVRILQLIDTKYPEKERGDLLIFLSGIKEITAVAEACEEYSERRANNRWIVLKLHSSLSLADQDKVFDYAPEGARKCIVSTNIAETSITIDEVRFVCDSGMVKEMQYDPTCKMQRLKEFWISQASAEQRKGRAGRTGPGVCFRMYEEKEFAAMQPYSTPEIHRVPLDATVLQLVAMGLPDVRLFPFIEKPPPESVENSVVALKEVGAMHLDETLNVVGSMLAKLPVDVTVGKMLIMGTLFHQVDSVLTLAAALSVQTPFTNNAYKDQDCVAARRNMDSDHGDPVTLLNAYREWLQVKSGSSGSSSRDQCSRKWCRKRGLEEQRFYEMTKLRQQFKTILEQSGLLSQAEDSLGSDESFGGRFSSLSGAERARRHGELKRLRRLKRELQKTAEESAGKRKVLKVFGGNMVGEDNDDEGLDIKDIEFRMTNDPKKVRDLLESSKAYSYKDLMMLKLILTSGLYPQFAIADEFNASKGGPDQLFHTRAKPFNVPHPNSFFASHPEVLALDGPDVIVQAPPGFPCTDKHPLSSKHQILVYMGLLETNKPYVVNLLRMPALHTLLLFARSIETNCNFGTLVFDSWIELRFPDPGEAQLQVLRAAQLRAFWSELLTSRLKDSLKDEENVKDESSSEASVKDRQQLLELKLSQGLLEFLHNETPFCMRRLLPGDLKVIYSKKPVDEELFQSLKNDDDNNPLAGLTLERSADAAKFSVKAHQEKGGCYLTDYLLFNCLENSAVNDSFCKLSGCPTCEETFFCSALQRMVHVRKCSGQQEREADERMVQEKLLKRQKDNPNAKEYVCSECGGRTFYLTPLQLLQHKKSHNNLDRRS